jgi:hypothetical protein
LSLSILNNNRISGNGYDAAGNMTSDGLYSYAYNAENEQTSAAGVTYTYDGDGKRVEKSTGTLYWYGLSSQPLLETDSGGGTPTEYVFLGGQRIARRESSGAVYYYLSDHLGSSRVIANSAGTLCYDADFYPYGGERVVTDTCPQNYKFTGKERDTEIGKDAAIGGGMGGPGMGDINLGGGGGTGSTPKALTQSGGFNWGQFGTCVEENRLDNALRQLGAAYGHPTIGNVLANSTDIAAGAALLNQGANLTATLLVPFTHRGGFGWHSTSWSHAWFGEKDLGRTFSNIATFIIVAEGAYEAGSIGRCAVISAIK